jgi:hypothetical protein
MRVMMILVALAMTTAAAPTVQAQTLDKNGKCHDASGKFAKADVCKGVKATTTASAAAPTRAPAAAAVDPKAPYKLDAKGKCHDAKGKMAAKSKCA